MSGAQFSLQSNDDSSTFLVTSNTEERFDAHRWETFCIIGGVFAIRFEDTAPEARSGCNDKLREKVSEGEENAIRSRGKNRNCQTVTAELQP